MGTFGFTNEDAFDGLIWQYAKLRGLDPLLVKATIAKESSFQPAAFRAEPGIGDASRGLMQVLYKTAVWLGYRGDPDGLFDPETSIDYGTRYLAYQAGRYAGGPITDLYAAYNAGSVRRTATGDYINQAVVDKWLDYYWGYVAAYDVTPAPAVSEPAPGEAPPTSTTFSDLLADYTRADFPPALDAPSENGSAPLFSLGDPSTLAALAGALGLAAVWILMR